MLKGAAAVAVLFAVVLSLTFPTDDLVRWVLARVPVPEGYLLTFQRAHLRPWGLVLDDAAYRHGDGKPVVETQWLRLRPSWTAFWSDRLGRPWHVAAGVFGGTVEGRIAVEPAAQLVDVSWTDVDVAGLLAAIQREGLLTGRSTGHATLRLPVSDPASGEGDFTLRSAVWQPPLAALEEVPIHADKATARWTLADGRVQLSSFDMQGEEVDLTVNGTRPPGAGDREQHDRRPHDDHAAAWQSARAAPAARRVAEAAGRRARLPRDRHDRCPARLPTVAGRASACSRR